MDLFERQRAKQLLAEGAYLLPAFALASETILASSLVEIEAKAPFRKMQTPGGKTMSVSMTNAGSFGWVSDLTGYRYQRIDPLTGLSWPSMPEIFKTLAARAALEAGFCSFDPDACLINRYGPTSKLSLHQDKDEKDFTAPIVSFSLGLPATFLFGGMERSAPVMRVPLFHGDVVVFGGTSRLRFHGVAPVKKDMHPIYGAYRINLTFRKSS